MSNETFLWIFSRGIELGVIVVCLLPLRALLRRKVPRLFSYVLWIALPMDIAYRFVTGLILRRLPKVSDYIHRLPKIVIEEKVVLVMKWCWIGGTAVVVLGLAISYLKFLHKLTGSIRLQKGVYLAERIRAPFTLGLLCPKIYLPLSLSEEYYEYVILHERVHISRKDVWMKYLAVGFLGLFWFQPLLWIACHLVMDDMEEACDETVIRNEAPEFREGYARALVELSCQAGKVRGAAIGYGNGAIKSRIRNIMNYKQVRRPGKLTAIFLCVLFVFASVAISWQIPRMVHGVKYENRHGREVNIQHIGGGKAYVTVEEEH